MGKIIRNGIEYGGGPGEDTTNWLKGKTINFLGDSITYGYDGQSQLERPMPAVVASYLNCTCNNYGVPGSTLCGSNAVYSKDPMTQRVESMNKSADVNVVMGGSNDWFKGNDLGSISDDTDGTIYGALNIICSYLVESYPNAVNIICSPIRTDSNHNYSYTKEDIAYACYRVAKKYNMIFIDCYHNAPMMNPEVTLLKARYTLDGTHPNQLYIDKYFGKYIAENILNLDSDEIQFTEDKEDSLYFLSKKIKVINFEGTTSANGNCAFYDQDSLRYDNSIMLAVYCTSDRSSVCIPYRGNDTHWGVHCMKDSSTHEIIASKTLGFKVYYIPLL